MHRPPKPPRPAVVLPPAPVSGRPGPDSTRLAWLVRFIAAALMIGVLVILAVAIFQWRS